jgi:hypothetical protein
MTSNGINDPIPAALRQAEFFDRAHHVLIRLTTTHGDVLALSLSREEAAAIGETLTEYAERR